MRRIRLTLALCLTIVLVLAAAIQGGPERILNASATGYESDAGREGPIRIGALLPLSGKYARLGSDTRRGIERALSELGERAAISIIYGDSRAEPAQAISEFRRMSSDVQAIYAFRGPVGMAINPLSRDLGLPLLGGVGNAHFAADNDYAFQLWPQSPQEGAFLAEVMARHGAKRVALITAEDDWLQAVSDGLRKKLSDSEIEVVFDESVTPSDMDFRTLITKVARSGADSVFVNTALSQIGPLLKQMESQSSAEQPARKIYSNFWAAKPEVREAAGTAIEGVYFTEPDTAAVESHFRHGAGSEDSAAGVSAATLSSYIAAYLLQQAAEEFAHLPSAERSLYRALLNQHTVRTPIGEFKIENRRVEFPLALRVIEQQSVQQVDLRASRDADRG